jgi:ABC-type antimicrobial peptide transport system permease subunit
MMIVGVVGDAVYHSFRERPRPALYLPLAQFGASVPHVNFFMAIRSAGPPPAALERSVTAALTAVNPDLTLKFQPLNAEVDAALAQDHLVAVLSGFFGGLALLLAGLGLYGVTSYAVNRRRIELGIRMALGASPGAVVRIVLRRVAVLVGAGVIAGALVTVWASRFAKTLLYGVQPRDPATLVASVLVLTAVATCAAALPAWRASRIDPAVTLREQ